MGSQLSSQLEFNEFYNNLTEKSSLPLYLCFALHTYEPKILLKIKEISTIIEDKYMNKNNRYAVLTAMSEIFTDFCDYNSFANKLKQTENINYSYMLYQQQNISHPKSTNFDLYQYANLNLTWDNAIKIILDIDLCGNSSSFVSSREKLIKNNRIQVFDLKSLDEFDFLLNYLNTVDSKLVVEKYVPLYQFSKQPHSNRIFNSVVKINFKKEVLKKSSLYEFDLNAIKSNMVEESIGVCMENVPFAEGNEVYCFKGYLLNDPNKMKVFKLGKYKEIELETNFFAQTIAGFLATHFCN